MTHEEFLAQRFKGRCYYMPELSSTFPEWGDDFWCDYGSAYKYLHKAGYTQESWYREVTGIIDDPKCSNTSCGIPLKFRTIKLGYASSCSAGCSLVQTHKDPDFKAAHGLRSSERMTKINLENWQLDDYYEKKCRQSTEQWKDPKYREEQSKRAILLWEDIEFKEMMSKSAYERAISPEFQHHMIIKQCESYGTEYLEFYIATNKNTNVHKDQNLIKIGVAKSSYERIKWLGLKAILSIKLPFRKAADLEYLIKTSIPPDITIESNGGSEYRHLDKLSKILDTVLDYFTDTEE